MLDAIIIGLVEGLTEFLPISSTGHMLIAESFLKMRKSDAFYILIQIGPILASALVFYKDIINITKDYLLKLSAAFFITGAGGFVAKKLGLELPESVLPVTIAVIAGAFVILAVERKAKNKVLNSDLTWAVVLAVAAGQLVAAVFPGASRSGMAIMFAIMAGFARPDAVKFSFLVGIPTMFAAGGYSLISAIKESGTADLFTVEAIVAYIVASVSAWLTVVWLMRFVQSKNFIPFAWYRLVLGIILLGLYYFKLL